MLLNKPIFSLSNEGGLEPFEETGVCSLKFLTGGCVSVCFTLDDMGRQLTWVNEVIKKVLSESGQGIVRLTAQVNHSDHFMKRIDGRSIEDQVAENPCV
jgi:hypothetical protein